MSPRLPHPLETAADENEPCDVFMRIEDGAGPRFIKVAEARSPEYAEELVRVVNVHHRLVASLRELSEWMRARTGPADGTVEMLTRAHHTLAEAEAAR